MVSVHGRRGGASHDLGLRLDAIQTASANEEAGAKSSQGDFRPEILLSTNENASRRRGGQGQLCSRQQNKSGAVAL